MAQESTEIGSPETAPQPRTNARIQIGYFATAQQAVRAGINGFAVQLLAESFGDQRENFPEGGIAFRTPDHQGRPVWITISEEEPVPDRFQVIPSGDNDLPWAVFDTKRQQTVGGIHLSRVAAQMDADVANCLDSDLRQDLKQNRQPPSSLESGTAGDYSPGNDATPGDTGVVEKGANDA